MNRFADQAAHHAFDFPELFFEFEAARMKHLLAAESEKLMGETGGMFRRTGRGGKVRPPG